MRLLPACLAVTSAPGKLGLSSKDVGKNLETDLSRLPAPKNTLHFTKAASGEPLAGA
jgi:hypothetical protein